MKRIITALMVLLACSMLVGCCLSHEWQAATCDSPRTCGKCGATEGEPLGHTWNMATCTEAKICTVCEVTEGEPLGHKDLTEANYQQAAMCGICGEEVGEPLTPGYEKLKVPGKFFEVGDTVDYFADCFNDPSKSTKGRLSVVNYETFASDETHPAKDGYEWKTVDFEILFSDEEAYRNGFYYNYVFWDYYGVDAEALIGDGTSGYEFEVNWNGIDYMECRGLLEHETSGWYYITDSTGTRPENRADIHCEVLAPVGYDGCVVSFTRTDEPLFVDRVTRYTQHFRLD